MKFLLAPAFIVAIVALAGQRPKAPSGGGSSGWDKPTWMKSPLEALIDLIMGG